MKLKKTFVEAFIDVFGGEMSDKDTLYESISQWMQSLELNDDGCVGCAYLCEEHETETCPASLSCNGSVSDCPRVERAVSEVFCG